MTTSKKPTAKTVSKPAVKKSESKAAPVKTAPLKVNVKPASVETLKLIDQQVAKLKKGSNRIVMPELKDAKVVGERKTASGAPSKMSIATELYTKHKAEGRKVVLAAFIATAGLTKAGANTYYANLKKKLG